MRNEAITLILLQDERKNKLIDQNKLRRLIV